MIMDERRAMIGTLNDLVDFVDRHTDETVDVSGFARSHGTTEYHLRRMFAALAGIPFSEYVRRRRMTLAATDLVSSDTGLLDIAVRYGYSSVEAFGRAFRSVHGASPPADVRVHGGPFATQAVLRFRLTVEGSRPMDVTITDRPAFVLAGHAAQVPLIYQGGVNPHIQQHLASIAPRGARSTQVAQRHRTRRHPRRHRPEPARRPGGNTDHVPPWCGRAAGFDGSAGSVDHRGGSGCVGDLPLVRAVPGDPPGNLGGNGNRVVPVEPLAVTSRADLRALPRLGRNLRRRGDLDADRAGVTCAIHSSEPR